MLSSSCIIDERLSLDRLRFETIKDVSMNPSFDVKIPQERKNDINQLVSLSPVLTRNLHYASFLEVYIQNLRSDTFLYFYSG